ncbi:hypothetical protein JZ751_009174 [Albula glossodonta]|uniref:Uncharacterized protein n=1 Tax=Albula glossodonta TaxID=121402 RepID=A0A8T2N8S8_9TELE|nr:hypothetical protein JZ751_009174 [Albula glossodonta]
MRAGEGKGAGGWCKQALTQHTALLEAHSSQGSPPLTQFFIDCGGLVRTDKKPALCKSYQKLVCDLWHKNRWVLLLGAAMVTLMDWLGRAMPGYVVPTNLFQGIKAVNPMFRGYSQQSASSSGSVKTKDMQGAWLLWALKAV